MLPEITYRSAVISDDKKYRYTLQRAWKKGKKGSVLFILLNPSTADEEKDDPTIRRGIGFAYRWGYSRVCFCNLFARRTKDPNVLKRTRKPVGRHNDEWIINRALISSRIVVAWGANGGHQNRDSEVLCMLEQHRYDFKLYCFGKTMMGYPKHILYLPNDAKLVRYM